MIPLPFPNKPRSIITPMAIINVPLNEDTPPKDNVAQQKPNVVVGRKSKPAIGITRFGTPNPSNGRSTKALLKNHINTRINRGASKPTAAKRHMGTWHN